MSFKELELKLKYDSDRDNILKDFYLPVLSRSKKYFRLSGFFSSTTLALVARGMESFIKNNGEMKLICGAKLTESDYISIKNAQEDPQKILERNFINDLDNIKENFIKDHISALGWMIAKGNLKIKIAIPDENIGMFHAKVGILEDDSDNIISFSGSDNETASGWIHNIEEFKVFKSWGLGKEYLMQDLKDFENYWNGLTERTNVFEVPEAVKNFIVELAPDNEEELNITDYININNEDINLPKLREYQKDAVSAWFAKDFHGIFNMATGTGKTYTALGCFHKLKKKNQNFLTVIVCPQKHLISQWMDDIKNCEVDTLLAYSDNKTWVSDLNEFLGDFESDILKYPIILTTHRTFSSEKFIQNIKTFNGEILLIIDEVHGIGASEFSKGLLPSFYEYRLGLSATPKRWYDEVGTEIIENYFGSEIYSFSMKKALKKGFLTPYNYYPIFVDLNPEELEEYMDLTKQIARVYSKNEVIKNSSLENLFIKRQRIINNTVEKFSALKKLIKLNKNIKDLLVYCSDYQIDKVEKILENENIHTRQFTGREGTIKSKRYGNMSQRDYILKKFSEGQYHALVAMKCLDEGVDVPSAKTAILMSSTSNPREHIQRRGRLLRKDKNKDLAIIYDFLVLPNIKSAPDAVKNIIKKELNRYEEFADLAKNSAYCSSLIIDKWSSIK